MFVSTRARVYTDATGAFIEIPVLLTPTGVLEPLVDYSLTHAHDRSISWHKKTVLAVELFLEYVLANPEKKVTYRLFQDFVQRLYTGTSDPETGLDPSGLCWLPRSVQVARNIVSNLTDFFEWLVDERHGATNLNPRYVGSRYDQMMDEAAYRYRRDKAFLGNTWKPELSPSAMGHRVRFQRPPKVEGMNPPAFPDDRFMDLLWDGFKVGRRQDYRNMAITLLLHGAGFRNSEPLHLFIGDVFLDPNNERNAVVRIYHPSHGAAPSEWKDAHGRERKGNRAAYLIEQFGLMPRTKLMESRGVGWKGGMLSPGYFMNAYWFPPDYGVQFREIWDQYITSVACIDRNHPFAFVNLRRHPIGGMYCLAQYEKAHAAACNRIGLTVAKALGTTPHGHRHSYGRRLKKAKVDTNIIRICMHHASIESQNIYGQPTIKEVRVTLEEAAQRMQAITKQSTLTVVLSDDPTGFIK